MRTRWRAFLLLARVSNLPTVWSNVLAGTVGRRRAGGVDGLAAPSLWSCCWRPRLFYTGGMFLNDAFDAPFDRVARPERPIPRGEVGVGEAFAIGGGAAGVGPDACSGRTGSPSLLGVVLAAAIVFYDCAAQGQPVAPLVMGACRGLVYLVAAAVAGAVPAAAWSGAGVMIALRGRPDRRGQARRRQRALAGAGAHRRASRSSTRSSS